RVADAVGWTSVLSQLEQGPGEAFAASIIAFEDGNSERIAKVLEVTSSNESLMRAVISALGWMHVDSMIREARKLMDARAANVRRAGLAAMAIQRQDPGRVLVTTVQDLNSRLAARSMRAAAELGRVDLLETIRERLLDTDEICRLWAAWSAVRLGDRRTHTLETLRTIAAGAGPFATRALDIAVRVMTVEDGHNWRLELARHPLTLRLSILCAATIGDPSVIPELIIHMQNQELARLAACAFSMITGAALASEDLEGEAPQTIQEYPTENPDDDAVAPDVDFDLTWPEASAVAKWWDKRKSNYTSGMRYLLGHPM